MSKDLLVITKSKLNHADYDRFILLGKWCINNETDNAPSFLNAEINKYHWDDIRKRKSDNSYLKELNEKILHDLILFLNKQHNTDHPYHFWKIVIGPWLLYYTGMLYDRWETIRLFTHKSDDLSVLANDISYQHRIPNDYIGFIGLTQDASWNTALYIQIINEFKKRGIHDNIKITHPDSINEGTEIEERKPWESFSNLSFLGKLVNKADKILSALAAKSKVVIYEVPFTKKAFLFINLRLGQPPALYGETFSLNGFTYEKGTLQNRKKIDCPFSQLDLGHPFESFLKERIFLDIPSAYLESFLLITSRSKTVRLNPKLIVSAKGHWWNELFKIWIANKHLKGVKLVFTNHGGSIPVDFELNFQEEDASDVYFNWSRPFHPKHVQVPPSKFILRKRIVPGNKFLVIGNETYRYPVLLTSGNMSADSLQSQNDFFKLYERLNANVQDQLLFRPYANIGWDTGSMLKKKLGEGKVNRKDTLFNVFKKARLILCTYPETTFLEALISGIPTLLLVEERWKFDHNFDFIVNLMKDKKIIFTDPFAAAKHINDIWDAPSAWWESPGMKPVRDEIPKWMGDTHNGVNKWVRLLKKELK